MQENEREYRMSRIPRHKTEDHLQLIFGHRFPGSLFSLSKPRPKSRAKFATGTITIPESVVKQHQPLMEALKSPNGIEMNIPPIGKLYFRPKNPPDSASLVSLEKKMKDIRLQHQKEIHSLNDKINTLHSNYLTVVAEVNKISEYLNSQATANGTLMPQMQQSVQQYAVPLQHYNLNRDHSRSYENSPTPTHIVQQKTTT